MLNKSTTFNVRSFRLLLFDVIKKQNLIKGLVYRFFILSKKQREYGFKKIKKK